MNSDLDRPRPSSLTHHGIPSHLQVARGALLEAEEGGHRNSLFQEDQAMGVEGQASPQALSLHSAYPESGSQRGMELGWGQGGSTLGS